MLPAGKSLTRTLKRWFSLARPTLAEGYRRYPVKYPASILPGTRGIISGIVVEITPRTISRKSGTIRSRRDFLLGQLAERDVILKSGGNKNDGATQTIVAARRRARYCGVCRDASGDPGDRGWHHTANRFQRQQRLLQRGQFDSVEFASVTCGISFSR